MPTWEEQQQDGFTIMDEERRIAIKVIPADTPELIKHLQIMLANAYFTSMPR